jgi:hypothetical protein
MEDISRKTLVGGAIIGAIWLSFAITDNDSTGAAQLQNQQETAVEPTGHTAGHGKTESTASHLHPDAVAEITADDEVDIALGGSWENDDCTYVTVQVLKVPSGELVDAVECQRSSPKLTHEYESWSDETLSALTYSDPIACLVLGRRTARMHPKMSWDLMIRSSALLGGDTRPIRWLATNSFNQVKANGEMATGTLQRRYVLDTLADRLEGNQDLSFNFREDHLRKSMSDDDFERLNRMVDTLLHNMKVIEEETTGESTIRGAG